MLTHKKILMGITGGIAAYKSACLASGLIRIGNEVKVVMTKSAREFITPLTLKTLTRNKVYPVRKHVSPDKKQNQFARLNSTEYNEVMSQISNGVYTDMFDQSGEYDLEHINLAKWADFILIAPATYNIIGKISNGIADDLLTSTVAAYKEKVFLCPAMNDGMWVNPVLKANIEKLKNFGFLFIGPEKGRLACGDDAEGRMTEPEEIIKFLDGYFSKPKGLPYENNYNVVTGRDLSLRDKKILITSGATREPIDPVRFISNYSSGKMGYALAQEAKNSGAEVTLISGPSREGAPAGVKTINVQTAREMLDAVKKQFGSADIFISCAAVSDYRPAVKEKQKIKKVVTGRDLSLQLIPNPDILKTISKNKKNKILVGFAAESNDLIKNAKSKLKEKKLDIIVANDITAKDSGFESNYNTITIITNDGAVKKFDRMLKSACAKIILEEISAISN